MSTVSYTGFQACGQSSAGLVETASETALDEAGMRHRIGLVPLYLSSQ